MPIVDKHVRRIARIVDIDGAPVFVGVDYDTVTVAGDVRLNRAQRQEFVKALAVAAEAVVRFERAEREMQAAEGKGFG